MKTLLIIFALLLIALVVYLTLAKQGKRMGPSGPPDSAGNPPRDPAALTKHLNKPAVHLVHTDSPSRSYFGGLPPLYDGFQWPEKGGLALSFLACIDLAEIPGEAGLDWLPQSGRLLFFYDEREMPWGFDLKHRGGWKVIYVPSDAVIHGNAPIPKGLDQDWLRKQKWICFRPIEVPPSWGDDEIDSLNLSEAEMDAFCDFRSAIFGLAAHHQMGGYADNIQTSDMQRDCELVTHGLDLGDPAAYKTSQAQELKKSKSDWLLLFQIDTDDDLEMMWGDGGMIYYWIRRQDVLKRNFDDVWLFLECY
jgi:uncharacterized protein YwqG